MAKAYFPEVSKTIAYEGPQSKNPLAYKWYNPDQVVAGKTMKEHFRFAIAYWHTYKANGTDMFGPAAWNRPWNTGNAIKIAQNALDANFEFVQKLGLEYYCFHDRDIAPEGNTIAESRKNLQAIIELARKKQDETGIKLLWGTANLFSNPRYTHGAGTNPDFNVFAYAAAQLKDAIDATAYLGGENYVFWGGREGYETLLNTRYKQETSQLAALLRLAVEYKKKIGFKGQFLIEPKPKEPTKHQYDFDSATVIAFLKSHGLDKDFKLNIEANHATLAGHTFEHELTVAAADGKLGSIDANAGDVLLGWDTDQFPVDIYSTTKAMLVVLENGGIAPGGFNFDAKCRRGSFDTLDLFYAHIGGIDAFARGLLVADKLIKDKALASIVDERYATWKDDLAKKVLSKKATLEEVAEYAEEKGEPARKSGRQELLEIIVNDYLLAQ
ncbi:MAG: xylose isomerase [Puniceicoccales bacterium]|jgi:xylose isomerase|nr:xylose isomerase [Puniceicoccales bacterium]